ncbi:MAG: ribosome biogenesis GTPase Der, partial [Symbiobacteriaceae bacterium]|nr:ribosome biogenesis GTPase Der [Symbiobacteriaceae bacterium]
TGQRLPRLLELTKAVAEQQTQRIATAGLNDWLQEALRMTPPPSDQGHPSRIYYVNQVSVKPPTFVFFCNNPAQIHFSYQRYLDNQIRNAYGFTGTPLRLIFRQR